MITLDRLREVLRLNDTKDNFVNKVNRGKVREGDLAGRIFEGYTYMCIDYKTYPAHHLMWLWYKGELPEEGFDIDHIDMDRNNNHINNLRITTRAQNMLNTVAHKDSKSGSKNVFFRKDTGKWSVRMTVGGKYKSLGSHETKELAELVACEARAIYHGEYANG